MRVTAERGGGLQDGIETPAGDAVDEEADEEALAQETDASLKGSAGEKEEREDIVVDAEIKGWEGGEDAKTYAEDGVETQIARETALTAETPALVENDGEENKDDNDERGDGAGLLPDVVAGEALDGDPFEGVVA